MILELHHLRKKCDLHCSILRIYFKRINILQRETRDIVKFERGRENKLGRFDLKMKKNVRKKQERKEFLSLKLKCSRLPREKDPTARTSNRVCVYETFSSN